LTLLRTLAFNHICGAWPWLVECFLAECRAEDARSGNSMIRIETDQTESQLTFRIAGKLCGASVRALEDCWKAAHLSSPTLEKAVDLSDVSSIDKAGWCLLRHMHRDGVRFSAKGLAGQTVLDELTEKDKLTCKEEKR
jgi:ABC-type transporter Mla MlaB component